jgi:zinc protease
MSPQDDIDAIRAVTVKDVARVARQYLDQAHAMTAILTPSASGKPVASKGFGGKESFGKPPKHDVKLPAWAEKAVNRLELPASTIKPTVYTMPNGLKLIVQPEHISKTVGIYGHIRNRPVMEVPQGKEGVDEVLDQLLSYGSFWPTTSCARGCRSMPLASSSGRSRARWPAGCTARITWPRAAS